MFRILKRPNFWVMLLGDAVLVGLAYYLAYYLRFDGDVRAGEFANWANTVVWIVPLKLVCFFFFGLYKGMWRYTGIYDLENLIKACVISSGIIVFILVLKVRFVGFPRSIFAIDLLLTFLFMSGVRVGIRLFLTPGRSQFKIPFFRKVDGDGARVLVVGAGSAGEKLLRELNENPEIRYQVAGCIDDDKRKLNQTIHGVPVLGSVDEIKKISEREAVDEIIIAISAASAMEMRRVVSACEATGLPCKTLPGVGELIEGKVSVGLIRKIRYEDLLGRRQVELNLKQIGGYLTGKRVMVTGGVGSIGSELCRQIVRFTPKKLIVVDINESGLYDMEMDFKSKLPDTEIVPVLCPIQDRHVMLRTFERENPEVVFHAAAYKHVPMMELHPWEAVLNNIVGTQCVLDLCVRTDVRRCVVVSTDKAVRPTNVMGASKRIGELLAEAYATELGARNMCVRFGNVIYSVGSVVPLFRKQIERGGPVTLTHRDVMRYFMTIPEASRLILQAGAIGNGGEIFILKMGTPVRIADMARDLIRLSGFEPDKEIEIKEIGLRPGEKLIEELITEGEGICETSHGEIMVLKAGGGGQVGNGLTLKVLRKHIKRLVNFSEAGDGDKIREELRLIVPEYGPETDAD
ncbi:MAG: polysaccharide biosynthesis protein [Deltaproteobacteria bacterium]|nr:polysaccharide biosynthesis protein [Deltaproteobacteria bacterium]